MICNCFSTIYNFSRPCLPQAGSVLKICIHSIYSLLLFNSYGVKTKVPEGLNLNNKPKHPAPLLSTEGAIREILSKLLSKPSPLFPNLIFRMQF